MDVVRVLRDIEDHLLPRLELDPIERILYYHLFRRTHLTGKDSGLFSLLQLGKALGVSETAVRDRIRTLHEKGCLRIEERSKNGHLVKLLLPDEIPGLIPAAADSAPIDVGTVDFFTGRKHVAVLVAREDGRCFYCLRAINRDTCVLDHVIPRLAATDHSFRNVVAACHECNALKQGAEAAEFLRSRYRSGVLSQSELQERLATLERLQIGQLVPEMS